MKKQKSKKSIESDNISTIVKTLETMSKKCKYGTDVFRRACQRFASKQREQRRLEKIIKRKEEELKKLKVKR